ncbi:uncharacterized protein LOC129244985 [Anastrepha obliqua]|uniref:uncharacterized protein LOC129244985 n=1 Tax=Anastrepha obliqua TaxID=95512 RepID=UPI002409E8A3|nr:uncharacterized protein LOC129244985 [Anastrepha obliqua]
MWLFKVLVFIITILEIFQTSTSSKIRQYSTGRSLYFAGDLNKDHVENISFLFYKSAYDADISKIKLQSTLRNFLENLQKNLTISSILKIGRSEVNLERSQQKLNDHMEFFRTASHFVEEFSLKTEHFLQVSKNESASFLLKLRRVPTGHRILPPHIKLQFTTYFAEMEFFNVLFFEVINEGMEYIINALQIIRTTFDGYADIQRYVLQYWDLEYDNWCYNQYFEFLQKWSTQIYNCATSSRLEMVYDVYAMTETVIKHVMRQLEFKMQRLFNCFTLDGYIIKCSFLRNAERDFEELFTVLRDLQTYYDIAVNQGRVEIKRKRRSETLLPSSENESDAQKLKCIPYGFPENEMLTSLKMCFNINKSTIKYR